MALEKIDRLFKYIHTTYSYDNVVDYAEMFEYIFKNSRNLDNGEILLKTVLKSFTKYNDIYRNGDSMQKNFKFYFSVMIFKYDCYDFFKQTMHYFHDIDKFCDYNYICVYGNLNVLQHLTLQNIKLTKQNMFNICKYGYVDILKWFFDKNCKMKTRKDYMTVAFKNGNLNILKFLHSNGIKLNYNYKAIEKATQNKHYKLLNWLNSNGYVIKINKNIAMNTPIYNLMFVTIDFGEMNKLNKMYSTNLDLVNYNDFSEELWENGAELIGTYEFKNTATDGENLIYYENKYTDTYLKNNYKMNFEKIVKYYETHFLSDCDNSKVAIFGFPEKVGYVLTYEIHKIMQNFTNVVYSYDSQRKLTNVKTHENAIYMIYDEI